MKAEEIYDEILKSPELLESFQISEEDLAKGYYENTQSPILEAIKSIIRGEENHRGDTVIFDNIKKILIK